MSEVAASAGRAPARASVAALVAIAAVAVATAWAALAIGHPGATAAPVLAATLAWAAWKAPLRAPAGILAFLVLALDDYENANGLWHSPLAPLGDLVHHSLQSIFPAARGIPLTGTEIAIALLLAAATWRRARGERLAGPAAPPRAVAAVAGVYLGAIALAVAIGVARGGSLQVAVWQTRPLVLTAALFFVFQAALRGRFDEVYVARVVVAAAVVRALIAAWVRWVVVPRSGLAVVEYATDHGDSMLFTVACFLVVAYVLERRGRVRTWTAAALLPILLLGIQANARRTAWLQLGLGLVLFLVVARGAAWRRQLGRAALVAAPLVLLYGAAGWGSDAAVFHPVQVVRSVIDEKVDRSTWDRKVEDWNLAMSMRDHPLGRGFGQEWTEYYKGDEITQIFWRYKTQPHNQVLGILLFAGPLLFVGIWAPLALLVLVAARAYPRARNPEQRAAALCAAATALVVAVQCFADLGPFWPQYAVLTGLALAAGGKLAGATAAAPPRLRPGGQAT
jgi:hypothetical protein